MKQLETPRFIHQLIEKQAIENGHRIALRFEDQVMTYRDLNTKANQLAHRLRSEGVETDQLVGICVHRSLEMVIGMLAILKAGGAYVPLDPDYPQGRLAGMLEDSAVRVLLVHSGSEGLNLPFSGTTLNLDRWDELELTGEASGDLNLAVYPQQLMYMIYTSGSTGKPKGAMNTHEAVLNRLVWMQRAFALDESDCVLQKTPYSFDVSVWEFFWPLMVGAALVIAKPEGHRDSAYLSELIQQEQITTLHFVPAMLQLFLEEPTLEKCTSLRRVICSGEALSQALLHRFQSKLTCELHNLYGPTEAAIDVTHWHCRAHSDYNYVPIGYPIDGIQIYIVDDSLQPVLNGEPGELCIGGIGLARGYHERTDLTAERFVPNPFAKTPGQRMYRTGDLARFHQDGSIEYIGRLDFQVKIRGYRIELGEIDANLEQLSAIRQAVSIVRTDRLGDKRIVSYYVSDSNSPITQAEIQCTLRQQLPEFMIPSQFIELELLPLTPNGKVDRNALPDPSQSRDSLINDYAAPQTAIEEEVAAIWASLFEYDKIGVEDDFIDLGGHSLIATQILSRIYYTYEVRVPLKDFIERGRTVRGLAEIVEEQLLAQLDAEGMEELLKDLDNLSEEEISVLLEQQLVKS